MNVIYADNPDHGLYEGLTYLQTDGERQDSRNGAVLVAPGPVTTVYQDPRNRVSFAPVRDANPFFHLMEALWMLAGRNDVAFVEHYAARMREFSDDNLTLNGAYGYRWRNHFGVDQIQTIANDLRKDPNSRRAVLSMWDARQDLALAASGGLDVPCNTQAFFRVRSGKLEMTVCNRSNDIVWGCYGANVVQFSFLQEALAALIGIRAGAYYQVSNNYHAYIEREDTKKLLARRDELLRAAPFAMCVPLAIDAESAVFFEELPRVLSNTHGTRVRSTFLADVVLPMIEAHRAHKAGNTAAAIKQLAKTSIDWHVAGCDWLYRRLQRHVAKIEVSF
jgi:Thymidylate synthase